MATITKETLRSWSGAQMRTALASPDRQAILDVIKSLNMEQAAELQDQQTKNDIAAIAGDTGVDEAAKAAEEAAKKEAEAKAAAEVEAARKAAEEAARPKKIVVDYQVTDEDGNPIGRPTHLEATSDEEMRTKLMEAHKQATRAFHRLKTQKTTFKQPQQPVVLEQDQDLLKAMEDLKSDKPETVVAAHRQIASIEARRVRSEENKAAEELRRQQEVSQTFLSRHTSDFNNCQANVNVIAEYFKENQLEWTLDNLEIAFHAVSDKLAPVVEPAAPIVKDNPQPSAQPILPTSTAVPVPQPTPTVTAQPIPQANPVEEQPRPGVNGGIIPGQTSGARPAGGMQQPPKTDWAAEIRSWDGPTMRRKMADPKVRPHLDQYFKDRAAGRV